jgi:hypothetical protein
VTTTKVYGVATATQLIFDGGCSHPLFFRFFFLFFKYDLKINKLGIFLVILIQFRLDHVCCYETKELNNYSIPINTYSFS